MEKFDHTKKESSEAVAATGTGAMQTGAIKKAEMELSDLSNRYEECYIIIGKRIAESLRNGEESSDAKVTEAFKRIQNFDLKKYEECYIIIGKRIAESLRSGDESSDAKVTEAFKRIQNFDLIKTALEVKIREIKGEKEEPVEAAKLVKVEEDVERDIAKCKELLEIGVDSQEEYDQKVATLRNKVTNFKKLDALDQALAKNLISQDSYKTKKANLLGDYPRDVAATGTGAAQSTRMPPAFKDCSGEEPYAFVSYAHQDAKLVYPLITKWHNEGVHLWYDEGIPPAVERLEERANAIDRCSLFIVLISPPGGGVPICEERDRLRNGQRPPYSGHPHGEDGFARFAQAYDGRL